MSNAVRAELQRTYADYGKLTSPVVVERARDPESPLHPHFEWDDSIAGHRYRLIQAANLIRSFKVSYRVPDDNEPRTVREWTATYALDDDSEHGYRPTEEVVRDPFVYKLALAECRREWQAFKAKYEHLQEFAAIVNGTEEGAA